MKRLLLASVLLLVIGLLAFGQNKTGSMYTAVWPGEVLILDEASGAIQSKIPLTNGASFSLTMSADRKKLYAITALMEGIEVVDIASRKVEHAFTLSSGNRKVRLMRNLAIHPNGNWVYAITRGAVKEIDRFSIDKPQIALIDVAQKKITKTLELPKEYSGNGLLKVSPDGKYLYFFFRDIVIIDAAEMKIVDKMEMARPLYPGFGQLRLGQSFEAYDEPNALLFLYSSIDPATNRNMLGFAKFRTDNRSLDWFEIGAGIPINGFAPSPDGKRAYALRGQPGLYEFYVFDLENKRVLKKLEYNGRPRSSIKVSSDGKKVYLHNAGNTIEYFDAERLVLEKSVPLPGDFTSNLFIVPGR